MFEVDAYSFLAGAAATNRDRPVDGRAWDTATVGLAAGLLQSAFRLDDDARERFVDLARHDGRMKAVERWRGC